MVNEGNRTQLTILLLNISLSIDLNIYHLFILLAENDK